jgi:hypothetical protein
VKLKHIVNVLSPKDGEKMWLVQILYVTTKGNPRWNHRVTLEGDLEDPSCAVSHLYRHLCDLGLDLTAFRNWQLNEEQAEQSLWQLSKETMRYVAMDWNFLFSNDFVLSLLSTAWSDSFVRTRFKAAAEKAGYPMELFSFHSLRAGFICSAMINGSLSGTCRFLSIRCLRV